MRLLEFQGKRIFSDYGIPVPRGVLITTPEEAVDLALPTVLKAQIPTGGRGKAGGIKIVRQPDEAVEATGQMLQTSINGYPVRAVLAEGWVNAERELFISLMIDGKAGLPLLLASAEGGIDIEGMARVNPQVVYSKHIDPTVGLPDYVVRYLAIHLELQDTKALRFTLERLIAMQRELDATIVEINPMGETDNGLVAMDAKIVLDDNARFRHSGFFTKLEAELELWAQRAYTPAQIMAAKKGITYVPLEGTIGVISDGAGTGMLTLDLIQDLGGQPANFCEMGGLSNAETMRKALEVVLADANVEVLLVSLIGGLTRMDYMGEGIAAYLRATESTVPVVVRMCGTQEELGISILRDVGIETSDNLTETVGKALALTREG